MRTARVPWAPIGLEAQGAVPGPEAMGLNVTRELGIDATVRVLRNVLAALQWLADATGRQVVAGPRPRRLDVVDRIGRRRPPGD